MASELREVLDDLDDAVNARENTCHPMSAGYERNSAWDQYRAARKAIEELPLLTPAAKAVIEAAVALVTDDPSDPWGYQKDVQFNTLRGEVVHYIATRGSDAN